MIHTFFMVGWWFSAPFFRQSTVLHPILAQYHHFNKWCSTIAKYIEQRQRATESNKFGSVARLSHKRTHTNTISRLPVARCRCSYFADCRTAVKAAGSAIEPCMRWMVVGARRRRRDTVLYMLSYRKYVASRHRFAIPYFLCRKSVQLCVSTRTWGIQATWCRVVWCAARHFDWKHTRYIVTSLSRWGSLRCA